MRGCSSISRSSGQSCSARRAEQARDGGRRSVRQKRPEARGRPSSPKPGFTSFIRQLNLYSFRKVVLAGRQQGEAAPRARSRRERQRSTTSTARTSARPAAAACAPQEAPTSANKAKLATAWRCPAASNRFQRLLIRRRPRPRSTSRAAAFPGAAAAALGPRPGRRVSPALPPALGQRQGARPSRGQPPRPRAFPRRCQGSAREPCRPCEKWKARHRRRPSSRQHLSWTGPMDDEALPQLSTGPEVLRVRLAFLVFSEPRRLPNLAIYLTETGLSPRTPKNSGSLLKPWSLERNRTGSCVSQWKQNRVPIQRVGIWQRSRWEDSLAGNCRTVMPAQGKW